MWYEKDQYSNGPKMAHISSFHIVDVYRRWGDTRSLLYASKSRQHYVERPRNGFPPITIGDKILFTPRR